MSKNKDYRYPTEKVDLMLWQYCIALQTIGNNVLVEISTLDKLAKDHFDHLMKTHRVRPSFTVTFSKENNLVTATKHSQPWQENESIVRFLNHNSK